MRKVRIMYFIILLLTSFRMAAQRPAFYIQCSKAMGDQAPLYIDNFERVVEKFIYEAFSCAKTTTRGMLEARLQWEKAYQEMGGDRPLSLCSYLKHDYLIDLAMIEMPDGIQISAKCFHSKSKKARASVTKYFITPIDYKAFAEGCTQVARLLVEGMEKYEICAFTGPVTLTQTLETDSSENIEYSVYCNGNDGIHRKESHIYKRTHSQWNLIRTGIPRTEGTMTFDIFEETSRSEMNDCHRCPSGRQGGRVYSETTTFRVEGSGLSRESRQDGKPQEDARIELDFREDGTYLVRVYATSNPVKGTEQEKTQAQGTCDLIPLKNQSKPRTARVPLKAVFGPFPGKASDKTLQQKETLQSIDPITGEKSNLSIELSLAQSKGK